MGRAIMADGNIGTQAPTVRVAVHYEGEEQFIVLPDAFRFSGSEVSISREGGRVIIQPAAPAAPPSSDADWAAFFSDIDALMGETRLVLATDDDNGETGQAS